MTITGFIEARAAERERAATDHLCINCGKPTLPLRSDFGVTGYIHDRALGGWDGIRCPRRLTGAAPLQDPDRALREVAAIRRILAAAAQEHAEYEQELTWMQERSWHALRAFDAVLRALAAIDAGHPDYDPSWAPEQVSA